MDYRYSYGNLSPVSQAITPQLGDIVEVAGNGLGGPKQDVYEVVRVDHHYKFIDVKSTTTGTIHHGWYPYRFNFKYSKYYTNNNNDKDNNMANAKTLRDSKLTSNERYLRKNGLVCDNGTLSTEGVAVLQRYLWDKFEYDIVAALKVAEQIEKDEEQEEEKATK